MSLYTIKNRLSCTQDILQCIWWHSSTTIQLLLALAVMHYLYLDDSPFGGCIATTCQLMLFSSRTLSTQIAAKMLRSASKHRTMAHNYNKHSAKLQCTNSFTTLRTVTDIPTWRTPASVPNLTHLENFSNACWTDYSIYLDRRRGA
jgi:hypothetical protein